MRRITHLHGSAHFTIPLSSCDSKDIFKIAPCLMIILIMMSDFINHGMVRNTKPWNTLRTEPNFSMKQKNSDPAP